MLFAEETQQKIKLLVADDQRLFSENLKLMLETLTENIQIVGIANDGIEAIEIADKTRPDIILMDVRMPGMDGVEATKILRQRFPEIRIVMLTTFLEDTYVEDALRFGAYGYLLKSIKPEELIVSLQAVYRGSVLFSPAILNKLMSLISSGTDKDEDDKEYFEIIKRLSNREKEIIKLIASGFNNQKIADTLFISEPTVRNYISSIYAKVGSKDRLQIISIARKVRIENE